MTNRQLYAELFKSENGKAVLEDLAKVLGADASTFDADPRKHAFNEGRREAVLYIRRRIAGAHQETQG